MEGLLLVAVLVVLVIGWWVFSRRFAEMERRIENLHRDQIDPLHFASLLQRVWQLENALADLQRGSPVQPGGRPAPPSQPALAPLPPVQEDSPLPATGFASPAMPAPLEPPARARSSAEWEALVGGNWLNKLGIFVLVMALALFLGYSFTQLGPAGRSAIGLAVSLASLGAGAALERRTGYAIFARGLLAGGWAGLYFTVYAMQAVAAARVIYNPLFGAVVLLAVATGMVLHSLRYRVQALTALAYFAAFAALAITPVTAFSALALIPLAASLLLVAYRFAWSHIALFGLLATYAACASLGDTGAPPGPVQTVLAIYWLLFEGYDLLRTWRHSNHPAERPLLTLNAVGFGILSWAKWSTASPGDLYLLALGVAAAYLGSTLLRAVLRPPTSFPPADHTLARILAGSLEGPLTLSAMAAAAAVVLKLHGQTVNTVLLAEGELLFLAGLLFRQNFFRQNHPRRLAAALFTTLGVKLVFADMPHAATVLVAGHGVNDWVPAAALASALFYCNRGLRKAGIAYGYAASALVATMLGFEISLGQLGICWLLLAALLFVLGWRFGLFDFRMQGYGAGALALGAVGLRQLQYAIGAAEAEAHPWMPLALTAAAGYAAALCARRSRASRLRPSEGRVLEFTAGAAATAASAALLWRTVPGNLLTVAWGIEGAALLLCGFPLRDRTLRLSGIVLFLGCIGKLFLYDLRTLETLDRILSFFVLGVILVGVSWLYTRFRGQIQRYW